MPSCTSRYTLEQVDNVPSLSALQGESCTTVLQDVTTTYRCLRFPATEAEYKNAFGTQVGTLVGSRRKCIVKMSAGCKGSLQEAGSPLECCSKQVKMNYISYRKYFRVQCLSVTECDLSGGCRSSLECSGGERCIDNKCRIPSPGVDCGTHGSPPLIYRCCNSGIID